MRYLFLALATLACTQTYARKNSADVGFLAGFTGGRITNSIATYTDIQSDMPAISFTADYNFDRGGRRVYFSIPVRLHTNYLRVTERYTTAPVNTYPYNYYSETITAASLGAGAGITFMPLMSKNADLCLGAGVVPAMEVGRFRGIARFNASGEVHFGVRMMNRVYLGARYTYFAMPYELNEPQPRVRNQYGLSNIQFDVRFRFRR